MISIVGYLASIFLGISLLVNNELKFRWINTVGCFIFIVYGLLLNAWPIIFTNSALFCINSFYLIKIYRTEEDFDILEYQPGDKIINKFLSFYSKDILQYFPENKQPSLLQDIRFVVLRDMVIANIFEAALQTDGTAIVNINYTVPKYRDYKVGKYIFENEKKYLTNKGIKNIFYATVCNKNHEHFLQKMGFKYQSNIGKVSMVKSLMEG